ncbi:MAG: hypothetical protein WAT20_07335, partial [Ferruginibacter sp.]
YNLEMAERSNAAVLGAASCGPAGSFGPKDPVEKTVEGQLSGGSPKDPAGNPSLSALDIYKTLHQ